MTHIDNDWKWALRVTQMCPKALHDYAWKILVNRINSQTPEPSQKIKYKRGIVISGSTIFEIPLEE